MVTTVSEIPNSGPAAVAATRAARYMGHVENQAIVVVDRLLSRRNADAPESLPAGWDWVFANTPVPRLFEELFAEAGLAWSAAILPEEQSTTFADVAARIVPRTSLVSYNGKLKIPTESLANVARNAEPLYVIVNGHQFPLCRLNQAMNIHRQNRCDVTTFDLCEPRGPGYDEMLLVSPDGRVEGVNRVYDSNGSSPSIEGEHCWPSLIVISRHAMHRLLDVALPQRINQWPGVMLRAGLRLQGCTLHGRAYDLHDKEQLHELADVVLRTRTEWICRTGGLIERAPRVWLGRNVRIAPTAEVIGPVVVGDDVEIGADAVVVGPTIIGRGSHVTKGMVLRRCLLQPGSTVGGDTVQLLGTLKPAPAAIERTIRIQSVVEAAPVHGGFRYAAYCFTKRMMDLIGSLILLGLTLPFYPLIALAIKANSPGPIFYGHLRQGRGGRTFKCWKFRTMVTNADELKKKLMAQNEVDGPQFKIKRDPRIFWVGHWLRRLNIDELPQFWNVLMGQMSLVGPRPSPESENQMCPAWREARLSVRPGVTGLWQVSRRRDQDSDFQEWIYYDVQYVKKQSIWLDIKILVKTLKVVLVRGGC
jgi:lipopolysaccharide/colanic/teichoic acid biosynthesis glycosyltransferase/carbonic anhydrase/acetyltransferase-like protein (isoleucine patch superfamily)